MSENEKVNMDDNQDEEPVLVFPCEMPMKIIGENVPEMVDDVVKAFLDQGFDVQRGDLKLVPSSGSKYVSVNYTFTAQSREQCDNLYRALTSNPRIKWVI